MLRRVTYDLTGLPPTPEEQATFLADVGPDAYARVVDRLLASPRYGERWGQHWLDVVRFAESAGHDGNNAYLHAWQFRDYVIRAFNADKPYDQFIVEQLAGDLLPKTGDAQRDFDQVVATGFLQVGPKPVVMRDKHQMLLDIADEQVSTTSVVFMGLTMGCAVPRPQVRSDPRRGLLFTGRDFYEHSRDGRRHQRLHVGGVRRPRRCRACRPG